MSANWYGSDKMAQSASLDCCAHLLAFIASLVSLILGVIFIILNLDNGFDGIVYGLWNLLVAFWVFGIEWSIDKCYSTCTCMKNTLIRGILWIIVGCPGFIPGFGGDLGYMSIGGIMMIVSGVLYIILFFTDSKTASAGKKKGYFEC